MISHNWVPESFTRTVIKLIPKKPVSRTVEDYRPITLINTDQKILSHLTALLQQIGLHPSTLGLIKLMYHHTDAFLDINGALSPVNNITNGVFQGCPLSSLLFILGLETFLFHLQHNTSIQSSSPFKIIAYADDITCCLKI